MSDLDLTNHQKELKDNFIEHLKNQFNDPQDAFSRLAEKLINPSLTYQYLNRIENEDQITFLSKDNNNFLLELLKKSSPSDLIELDEEASKRITSIWKNVVNERSSIPSDIFFAETIPLMDCEIQNQNCDKVRITIFDNFYKSINTLKENEITVVGTLTMSINIEDKDFILIIPIECQYGNDSLIHSSRGIGYIRISSEYQEKIKEIISLSTIHQLVYSRLVTWYGIQLSLLHPRIRTIYTNGKYSSSSREIDPHDYNTRRKIRYVRKHIINTNDFNQLFEADEKKFNRKTIAWYVIGHWRKTSNSEKGKVFINGHWRGPMREIKNNTTPNRIRVIDDKIK